MNRQVLPSLTPDKMFLVMMLFMRIYRWQNKAHYGLEKQYLPLSIILKGASPKSWSSQQPCKASPLLLPLPPPTSFQFPVGLILSEPSPQSCSPQTH